jgi:putative transposase
MKEFRTSRELANARLLGLPTTRAKLKQFAQRHQWKSCQIPGAGLRGGARSGWYLSNLSQAQQLSLLEFERKQACAEAAAAGSSIEEVQLCTSSIDPEYEARRVDAWRQFEAKSSSLRNAATDKSVILRAASDLIAAGYPKVHADKEVAKTHGISWKSIRYWRAKVVGVDRADWAPALADQREGHPQTQSYSSRVDDLIRADYLREERPSFMSCYRLMKTIATAEGLEVPSAATLKRHLFRDLTLPAIKLAREGKKAFEATYPAQERDRSVFRAMQAVCADGHVLDVLWEWPDGVRARPCIVSWIDLYSGMILAWRVDRTENADLVRLSFGEVLDYGLPEEAYLDNGMGFAAHWMSGRMKFRFRFKPMPEEPAGVFELLGIKVHWAIPHHGQSKPIERLHREFADRIARHPKFAGAWLGPSTKDRPEKRGANAIPLELGLEVLRAEIDAINNQPGRKAKTCNGRSFFETFQESYKTGPVRKSSNEYRDLCLLAVQNVTLDSDDRSFKLAGGNRYWSEAVARQAIGRKVTVRFDPQNLKNTVRVYQLTGERIGDANCIDATGFNDTEAGREHARLKRQNLKAHKQILENQRRMSLGEYVALLPSAPSTPDLVKSKVIRMVRPPLEPPVNDSTPEPEEKSPSEERFEKYLTLKAIPVERLSEADARWIRFYETGPEYRVRREWGLVG